MVVSVSISRLLISISDRNNQDGQCELRHTSIFRAFSDEREIQSAIHHPWCRYSLSSLKTFSSS
eukprot:COSAG02_NODE_59688_length_273_cov_1.068966_1_plen_63_part_10